MGKQAKLKHKKKAAVTSSQPQKSDPNQFIQDIEKCGYQLKQIQHSPVIPETKIEPQV